jgi:hypothetical protein
LKSIFTQDKGERYKYREFSEGFKFPVGEEGYVTLAEMRVEVNGILLGPVNAGGMIWFVYYNTLEKY